MSKVVSAQDVREAQEKDGVKVEDYVYDVVQEEFPKDMVVERILEDSILSPSGPATEFDLKGEVENQVKGWFQENVSKENKEAVQYAASEIFEEVGEEVEQSYKALLENIISEYDYGENVEFRSDLEEVEYYLDSMEEEGINLRGEIRSRISDVV